MRDNTLLDCYRRIYKQRQKWLYYKPESLNTPIITKFPTIDDVLKSNETAKDFVNLYLGAGEKESIINALPNISFRYAHAVSTFFFGIHLKSIFKLREPREEFLYLWFLTCLLHDADYEEEKTGNVQSLHHFCCLHEINYDLFSDIYKFRCKGMDISLLQKYFDYRLYACNKMDHGMCGGLILYDALRKIYDQHKTQCSCVEYENTPEEQFIYKGLLWSKKHWLKYARCAYAIAQHNVWTAEEKGKLIYTEYKLTDLIDKKLVYKTKLAALLVLCDTIDPVKCFEDNLSPCLALQALNITPQAKDTLQITLFHVCCENNCYSNRVKSLKNWTNLDVYNESFESYRQKNPNF